VDTVHAIAQATGAWLQYEFACGRSNLFNERYITTPVAAVLKHLYPHQVHSEFLHPILAPAKSGLPGRRPEVDFVVIEKYPKVICAVETKWVGKNGLSAEDILWDLMRLELIAHYEKAASYFVLAGRRKHLLQFFQSRAFLGIPTSDGRYKRLLKLDGRRNARIRLDNPPRDRAPIIGRLLQPYPSISFPSRLTTSTPYFYPEHCPSYQYQAFAWRVIAPDTTVRLRPRV
jgi:hypothetical protein